MKTSTPSFSFLSSVTELPKEERPMERLFRYSVEALSNAELLSLLVKAGHRHEEALHIAHRILIEENGLRGLKTATLEELTNIEGVTKQRASVIMAAVELGKRLERTKFDERFVIRSPADCAGYLMEELRFLTQEHFVCLYLNTKNQVIHKQTIFIGSLNASIVHPREVFREAFRRAAASVICFHNHPSGNPEPSREDLEVTKRLVECGKIIGIDVLDHIIIGEHKYVSLKEKGYV